MEDRSNDREFYRQIMNYVEQEEVAWNQPLEVQNGLIAEYDLFPTLPSGDQEVPTLDRKSTRLNSSH